MRIRTICSVVVAALAAVTLGSVPAQAQAPGSALGSLSTNRSTGTDTTTPIYTTQYGCPAGTDSWSLDIFGPGGFSTGLRATEPNDFGLSTTGPFPAQQNLSFREIAAAHNTTVQPGGYRTALSCRDSFTGAVLGVFVLNFAFTTPTDYTILPVETTTTALSVSPAGHSAHGTPVTLTASVSPANAIGVVTFHSGATVLGAAPLVGGRAELTTSSLPVGPLSIVAAFVGDPARYVSSASPPVPHEVSGAGGASANITTTVLPGELLISVDNREVVLPSPVMTADGARLVTAGVLNPVTVTDTRAGNPGWNVAGQVSDFVFGVHRINGANLGWSPRLLDKSAAQTVSPGSAVPTADAIAPGASPLPGQGLAAARTLAVAAASGGNGTARLVADLSLVVPTFTVAGTYTATLTVTAI
ncbi:Ig-like domain-containing protein [Actinokineospora diospyrosa]|uniref:Ig-like domain (Group 3) n=1 Tax=Actinokineospora diospyrosa TaxID=103728 RepID=A0ABT1IB67_9PSEU|nr:Ig-like domain-containing protein [Actinokineospora diospyrosa]MCP2269796.1 Ig-like domain (group 3) [Actinokineospora diospyrosa]